MIVALDFDGTYAEDPCCFDEIAKVLWNYGHFVVMVTQRGSEHAFEVESATDRRFPIVYAAGLTKTEAVREAGYAVDIWIDDEPIGIFTARTYMGPVLSP